MSSNIFFAITTKRAFEKQIVL